MAVTKAINYSGTYGIGDVMSVILERRAVSVEFEPHKFRTEPHLFAVGKFEVGSGEEISVEKEIDATTLAKAVVNSGIAALLVAEANKKIGG